MALLEIVDRSLLATTLLVVCQALVAARSVNTVDSSDNFGYFWHIADMHWDPTYATTSTSGVSCGSSAPPSGQLGNYGNYACDSPWTLINSSVYAMKEIRSDVDFIVWTGDDTPHNAEQSSPEVAAVIGNLTDKIIECFPNTTVFPVLGNHDWSPKSQLPPRPDPFYDVVANLWAPWLLRDPLADTEFRKGGYYSTSINAKLRLIGLNTNLYYTSDHVTTDMPDPACQFQWLDDQLTDAANRSLKVIIIGHVPPGQFEKHMDTYWFAPFFNDVFVRLLRKHSDVIGSAHFAHHHTDSFRLITDSKGKALTSFLIAPSVTPWETTLPGVMGGAGNNPSVRLARYDRSNGQIVDYEQFYLDLVQANAARRSNWTLAYRFTEQFGRKDATTKSLYDLAAALPTDDALFGRYYAINDLFYAVPGTSTPPGTEAWSRDERVVHCCAIAYVDYAAYDGCVANGTSCGGGGQTCGGATVAASVGVQMTSLFVGVGLHWAAR